MKNWLTNKHHQRFTLLDKKYLIGFTLIEVLIAIGMALIVVTASISITILIKREIALGSDKLEAVQNSRSILDRVTRDLRQAKKIVSNIGTSQVEAVSAIEFENGHDPEAVSYIEYYLSGTDLVRQTQHYSFASDPNIWISPSIVDEFGNPPNQIIDSTGVIANNVSQLELWINGTNLVMVEVTVTKNSRTSHMRTQVYGRNLN